MEHKYKNLQAKVQTSKYTYVKSGYYSREFILLAANVDVPGIDKTLYFVLYFWIMVVLTL